MVGRPLWMSVAPVQRALRVLLIGPYDPNCGEYTFVAPPLGVWRLKGFIAELGHRCEVFDPNCCEGKPEKALAEMLTDRVWDVIGVSTTGMTLRFDLALAHLAKRLCPTALQIAGGMEGTFDPESLFDLGPFDLIVLGEGELPMQRLLERMTSGDVLAGIPGTVVPLLSGGVQRFNSSAMGRSELQKSIALTPYDEMPYERYWQRLESSYRVNTLPQKAEREARLSEIRSVRLITLNYCPMACSFCSSTNFLHEAQGGVAKVARLDSEECLDMIERIVAAQPKIRSIIFQDDIFVFTNDNRIADLCNGIRTAKKAGRIPRGLQFISTNRIDAMSEERLRLMREADFRVLGFGVESFSRDVLVEFNKGHIYRHIEPMLSAAVRLGMTPFLDLILCSPRSTLQDVADTVRGAYRWILAGCEVGLYPYVVPFSGAKMANDPELKPYFTWQRRRVEGTDISWDQPEHIMPLDRSVRSAMEAIVETYNHSLREVAQRGFHLPSRARSLVWLQSAIPVLRAYGVRVPPVEPIVAKFEVSVPVAEVRSTTDNGSFRVAAAVA